MEKFNDKQKLKVAIWKKENIDTDIIIPSDFLKVVKKEGLGDYLFDSFRFKDKGCLGKKAKDREENKDFFLNKEIYRNAEALVTYKNFGCGSSREHAPWALIDYGFKVIISPSFANIFYENSFKNGLLLIEVSQKDIDLICDYFSEEKSKNERLFVDLEGQKIVFGENELSFEISGAKKKALLLGLDEIGMLLEENSKDIRDFEQKQKKEYPFLYSVSK